MVLKIFTSNTSFVGSLESAKSLNERLHELWGNVLAIL